MATNPLIRYDLDTTGLSPSNLIVDEPHTLDAGATRALAPKYGAFFTESVVVKDTFSGLTLTRGTDYICVELLQEASIISAKEICYLILITNASVSSDVTVTYQVLGGMYTRSADAIAEYYDQITATGGSVNWVSVLNKPFVFPPTDHLHDAADLYGFEYLVDSLERIRQAILMGNIPALEALIQSKAASTAETLAGVSVEKYVTPNSFVESLGQGNNLELNLNSGVVVLDGDINFGHGNEANSNRITNLSIGFDAGVSDLGTFNTFVGNYSGKDNLAGASNTGFGYETLFKNTSGALNTAVGRGSLRENTAGSSNTAVGRVSLGNNTTGNNNTAAGDKSLNSNQTGNDNTAVGFEALLNNTANNNTATGSGSLKSNTTGSGNTGAGTNSLSNNTTGAENTAIGVSALQNNTNGVRNTSSGFSSLKDNLIGNDNTGIGHNSLAENSEGNRNTSLGSSSLRWNYSASDNVAVGHNSLTFINMGSVGGGGQSGGGANYSLFNGRNIAIGNNTLKYEDLEDSGQNLAIGHDSQINIGAESYENVSIGNDSLKSISYRSYKNIAIGVRCLQNALVEIEANVGIGHECLQNLGDESWSNVAIGPYAMRNCTSVSSNVAIGSGALETCSNNQNVAIGSSALSTCNGQNNIGIGTSAQTSTPTSSNQIVLGNSFSTVLRCAVTSITALSDERDKKDWSDLGDSLGFINLLKPKRFVWNERTGQRVDIADTGFSAQQLKAAQQQTGYLVPGLVYEENPEKIEAAYSKLLPTLVHAVQQLSEENKKLQEDIALLKLKLNVE